MEQLDSSVIACLMILLRSTVTFRRCAAQVMSSFVIFAVLDLRVGGCRP